MPCVLEALKESADESFPGYGEDECCAKAADLIRALCSSPEAEVRFLPGATQTNFVLIAAALNSVQSVIAPDSGHINSHEAASIENTSHKILPLPNRNGKLAASQIESCANEYYASGEAEYLTEPKLVYISFPTEQGTLYSLAELEEISAVCKKYGMYLFVDGARMAYGLGSPENDVSLCDFARLADAFYLGGTKCGALMGEALVITNPALKRRFKAYMKQNGAVLAKGWLLGLQFSAMLENGEYFAAGKRADELALRIKAAFEKKEIPFAPESFTNQQFVVLTDEQKKKLSEKYIFEDEGKTEKGSLVRFCTSWATTEEDAEELIKDILAL